jgi:hypothetical protein
VFSLSSVVLRKKPPYPLWLKKSKYKKKHNQYLTFQIYFIHLHQLTHKTSILWQALQKKAMQEYLQMVNY